MQAVYPESEWVTAKPSELGLDPQAFNEFITCLKVSGASFGGEDHSGDQWGAVLTCRGYVLHTWGDPGYRFQTASMGKSFLWAMVGLAEQHGLIKADEPINKWWTGEGELSHRHKYLNEGHHKSLTWQQLLGAKTERGHYGGFPIEMADRWQRKADAATEKWGVPSWAQWTGDAFYDCYSHVEPGTQCHYSSAGYWRLGQALTHVWGRDLKEVFDEYIFSKLGVPAERWAWFSGQDMVASPNFYPDIPGAYVYLDPPYTTRGQIIRGGPGWVVISAADLARYGHLLACNGVWKGERLLAERWCRGHSGANGSGVSGESVHCTSFAVVAGQGFNHVHLNPGECFLPELVWN